MSSTNTYTTNTTDLHKKVKTPVIVNANTIFAAPFLRIGHDMAKLKLNKLNKNNFLVKISGKENVIILYCKWNNWYFSLIVLFLHYKLKYKILIKRFIFWRK